MAPRWLALLCAVAAASGCATSARTARRSTDVAPDAAHGALAAEPQAARDTAPGADRADRVRAFREVPIDRARSDQSSQRLAHVTPAKTAEIAPARSAEGASIVRTSAVEEDSTGTIEDSPAPLGELESPVSRDALPPESTNAPGDAKNAPPLSQSEVETAPSAISESPSGNAVRENGEMAADQEGQAGAAEDDAVERNAAEGAAEDVAEGLPEEQFGAVEESADQAQGPLMLDEVIGSVYQSYPLLRGALFARNIALGEQVAASGEFDLKIKGASENTSLGFYETYRHSLGAVQPLYGGGEVFAGYRVGRGMFEPWYLERQTNDGGEFKAGVGLPLLQNVEIDARRAALWQAQYGRQLVEPEIQAQLIGFVQEASYAYWMWVASGANLEIAERILFLAEDRTSRIEQQVLAEFTDPPELTDNLRLIAERRAKLADAQRKFQQSAVKLSLFLRDGFGRPWTPSRDRLPKFASPSPVSSDKLSEDIAVALRERPELRALDWIRRQLEVEYAQAENMTLPELDAVLTGGQDVGAPTSSKKDKSELELEASLYLDVPLQRRKARGKLTALEGKLAQVAAKRRMTADKIAVEVEYAVIALAAAYEQVLQTAQAVEFAEELAERERRNLDAGAVDVLKLTLREQYAAETAEKYVAALMQYYDAQVDLRAAMGLDRLP